MPSLWIFRICLANRRRKYLLCGIVLTTAVLMVVTVRAALLLTLNENAAQMIDQQRLTQSLHLKRVVQRNVSLGRAKSDVRKADGRKADGRKAHREHSEHGHYVVDVIEQPVVDPTFHGGHSLKLNVSNSTKYNNSSKSCQEWASIAPKPPYFLTAVLLVRIYASDKAKLTTKELKMWLEYLRYAGVEHVYIYDAWVKESESQLSLLEAFTSDGYITYIDWHTHNPYTIGGTQVAAYQHCIDHYSHENEWQAAIDIDEYPFSPKDTSPGFLNRYIRDYSVYHRTISEVTMWNYLFLGKPLEKELMIERLLRRTPGPANPLVKPIYKPSNVVAGVHHNSIRKGYTRDAPADELRMNHYWGARLQDWGDDTEEMLAKTIPDDSMRPIINAFKNCESQVRRYLE